MVIIFHPYYKCTQNLPNSPGYIFRHILEHFTTKLCNFTKFRMLFQDVVTFLPVSIFFKISSKRLNAQFHYLVLNQVSFFLTLFLLLNKNHAN